MTEVDERIVAMHFDNKQFEKGAKQTIKTLERLKDSMDLDDASESLENFGKAASELDLSDQAKNVEIFSKALSGVKKMAAGTFSATTFPLRKLGGAFKTLAGEVRKWFGIDLARDIEQAATRMVKSLTVEPVSAGWNEYEMKMDSIKTIMSGTKKEFAELSDEEHMGKVKETLEELNRYADETIYSFKDMTSSIGKFTNAGVKLDSAAKSMMGISNLAAQAGQGTQQASMAMYNFSQAMGLGYVELRDWRSIENANMATAEFKQTLIDVGISLGTLKQNSKGTVKTAVKGQKKVAVTAENLRETLNKKWLTDDVLETTLAIYSGELGEKEIRALGNFTDEQVAQFLKLGAEAKEAATQVRTFSKMYDALKEAAQSGWAISFEKIIGDMNEATALWTMINDKISGWMNKSADNRNAILNRWRGLSSDGSFRLSEIDGRQELIDALQNILDIVEKFGGAISRAFYGVFGSITGTKLREWSVQFNQMTANLSKWLGKLEDPTSNIVKISKALKLILAPIKALIKLTVNVGRVIAQQIAPYIQPVLDFLAALGDLVSNLFGGKIDIKTATDGIRSAFTSFSNIFKTLAKQTWTNVTKWFSGLFTNDKGERTSIGLWFDGVFAKFNEYLDKFKTFIHWEEIKNWASGFWEEILGFFRGKQTGIDFASGKAVYGESGFHKLFNGLGESFNSAVEAFKKFIGWDDLSQKFGDFSKKIGEWLFGDGQEVKGVNASFTKRSGLRKTFDDITSTIGSFAKTVENWEGWEKLGTFFNDSILQPIINFVTPQEEGKPSTLRQKFTEYKGAIRNFLSQIRAWEGWEKLGDFFTNNILQPIINFVTPQEEGKPSELRKKFDEYKGGIRNFIASVRAWEGWSKLGTFLNEKIITPIKDFIKSTDGEPSNMQRLFNDIVDKVSTFFVNIAESKPAQDLWAFFEKWIVTPIKRLWNFLVHGDADYDEKKAKKAYNPIAVLASASASDVSYGKKQNQETKTFFGETKEILETGLGEIMNTGEGLVSNDGKQTPLQTVIGWINGFSDALNSFKDSVQKAVDWLVNEPWEEHFNTLNEKLRQLGVTFGILNTGTLIGGVGRAFGGGGNLLTNAGKFIEAFKGFTVDISGGKEIGKGIKSLTTNFGEGIKDFLTKGGDFFKRKDFGKQIGQIVGNYKEGATTSTERVKSFADLLIELAGAVGIMVYAINSLLTKVKEIEDIEDPDKVAKIWERFDHVMQGVMTSIFATELLGLISSFGGVAKVNSIGNALIGLAAAIEGMVLAIGQLVGTISSNPEDKVDKAISVLTNLALLVGAFELFHNVTLSDASVSMIFGGGKASGLVGFAVAIESMVLATNQLIGTVTANEASPEKIDKALDVLWKLTGLITAFELLKNMNFGEKVSLGGGKASGLIGFSIAIEAMLHAVRDIAETSSKEGVDMAVVQGTVAEIAALITAFEFFKNVSSTKVGNFQMGGGKTGLIGFALAVEALVDAVRKLSELGKAKLVAGTQALDSISGFIFKFQALNLGTELLGSTISSDKFDYKGGKGTGLIGFVAAITAMLAEVVVIGALPEDQVKNGLSVLESLTGMINSFQGLSALESFTEKFGSTGQKVAAAVSLGLFVAGLAGILWAISELAKNSSPEEVSAFVGILDSLFPNLASFETFIGVMSALPNGSGWLGGAKAAINILEFVAILCAAAYGIYEWQKSDPKLFEGIEAGLQLAAKILGLFTGTLVGTHQGAATIALADSLSTVAEKADAIDLEKLEKLNSAVGLIKTMSENLPTDPTILDVWFKGEMSLSTFAQRMTDLGNGLRNFNQSVNGRELNGKQMWSALDPDGFKNAGMALETLFAIFKDYRDSGLNVTDAAGLAAFLDYLNEYDSGFNMSESFLDQFTKLGQAFSKGFGDVNIPSFDASGIIESLAVSIESDTSQSRLREAILKSVTGAIEGMKDVTGVALDTGAKAAGETLNNASKALEESAPDIEKTAEETVNQVLGWLGVRLADSTTGAVDETAKATYDASTNVPKAAANGTSDYAYMAANAAGAMGLDMLSSFRSALQIESPSKEFYSASQFIVQGVANGLANHQTVIDEVIKMGDDMMLAWQTALTPIDEFIQSKMNLSPRIAPVIDMSVARAGMNAFAAGRYSLYSTVPSLSRNLQAPNVQASQNGSQIVAAINDRIDQLNANIANLKLYLDTGALVGATVGAYDRALGFRASRSARG